MAGHYETIPESSLAFPGPLGMVGGKGRGKNREQGF